MILLSLQIPVLMPWTGKIDRYTVFFAPFAHLLPTVPACLYPLPPLHQRAVLIYFLQSPFHPLTPLKYSATSSAMYYPIVHGTLIRVCRKTGKSLIRLIDTKGSVKIWVDKFQNIPKCGIINTAKINICLRKTVILGCYECIVQRTKTNL